MKATKIKMNSGCSSSNNLLEIEYIYLKGCLNEGYYHKSIIYDFLKNSTDIIQVDIYPYPKLQPMISQNGEKYVRSEPDYTGKDNLLNLPKT